ncbi:MAG TPA: universal stress protein [Streptosporangiaceae bacterium]|nr:universal stress protein [Streptosporangiaceae bacterium]
MRAVDTFRRVLVAFDGSPDAAHALWIAAAVADAAGDGGELVVLCVIARTLAPEDNGEGRDGVLLRAQAETILGELARGTLRGILPRTSVQVVYSGGDSPGNVVRVYAQEKGFDILVLGRHGGAGRRKSTLGRVADRAVRACLVPVLLVSAPDRETTPDRWTMPAQHGATRSRAS